MKHSTSTSRLIDCIVDTPIPGLLQRHELLKLLLDILGSATSTCKCMYILVWVLVYIYICICILVCICIVCIYGCVFMCHFN